MQVTNAIMASLLLAGCAKGVADEQRHYKDAIEAVTAANAAKDQAMIARDPQALASFYTDDYQIIDSRADTHDKKSQVDFMTGSVELSNVSSDQVRVEMLAPDVALVTGRMTGRYRMEGKESAFVERYTSLWVKKGGRWRVKHEHGSIKPDEAAETAKDA